MGLTWGVEGVPFLNEKLAFYPWATHEQSPRDRTMVFRMAKSPAGPG